MDLEIDPWSIVTRVSAVSQEAALRSLGGCVEDVLLYSILEPGCGSAFRRYTSRVGPSGVGAFILESPTEGISLGGRT